MRAPETFKHHYETNTDIWAAGVILYYMVMGKYPFTGHNQRDVGLQIIR